MESVVNIKTKFVDSWLFYRLVIQTEYNQLIKKTMEK